jgi:protocatechuate 3,4-dioxygenase beta subunit
MTNKHIGLLAVLLLVAPLRAQQPGQPPANPGADASKPVPKLVTSIRGRVVGADGRPLRGVRIQALPDPNPSLSAIPATVQADGRYELTAPGNATYRIRAQKAGYLTLEYGQRHPSETGKLFTLKAGQVVENIDITLPRAGAVEGRVTDANGDPVEGVNVRLMQLEIRGLRRQLEPSSVTARLTDDRGVYRIYGAPPGGYVVVAVVGDRSAGSGPVILPGGYVSTYYPGSPAAATSKPISVALSAVVSGVDIVLARAATGRVSGTFVDAAGKPLQGRVTLTTSQRSGALAAESLSVTSNSDGTFEFQGVPAGDWAIQGLTPRPTGDREGEFAAQYLTTSGDDVSGVRLQAPTGSRVEGRLIVEEGAPLKSYERLIVEALPVDPDLAPPRTSVFRMRVSPTGTFVAEGLVGARLFRVRETPSPYSLRAVRVGGRDITDDPMPFGASQQSLTDVEIVLTANAPVITGSVVDAAGRRVSDYTVIAFSTDDRQWGPESRFVRHSRPNADGSFTIQGMPPDEYHVAALDMLQGSATSGEWTEPKFLEELVPRATRVNVAQGQTATVAPRLVVR